MSPLSRMERKPLAEVVLDHVTKRWGAFVGVRDFDLTIADREFLVLLGPSGCGKTTTMRMVAGLDDPSGGTIRIGDRVVNALEPKDRDIAMVFQGYGLYPTMSVYDNIRFPLKVRKVPASEHDQRVRRAADMVELGPYLERLPRELSGGQRQRVALARAIVRQPTVFLMDEPLSNLDAKLRVSTRAQIKHLQHDLAVTTIYVTHDQIEAMTLADRVVVMDRGVIQQVGSPTEIYDRPANVFVAGFIGSPAMNLLDGDMEDGIFRGQDVAIPELAARARGKVRLGFRAEDASVVAPGAGAIEAPVYAFEMLGDATLVTVRAGGALVAVKASKDFRAGIGEPVGLAVSPRHCHLFDPATQARLETHPA